VEEQLNIFLCSSPLQIVHSHIVRYCYFQDGSGDCILFCEPPVDERLVRRNVWRTANTLAPTKREYGSAVRNIRHNLQTILREVDFRRYGSVHLLVSDLFWLMNNVTVATLARECKARGVVFSFSILDEGALLYTIGRLSWKRKFRCWGRSLYLAANGLQTVIVGQSNADYRHPLCRAVYCLHPQLIAVRANFPVLPIQPHHLADVYGDDLGRLDLPEGSCLYLSQPLYSRIGIAGQAELVSACREMLAGQGIRNFYYKAHHFDRQDWLEVLESQGFHRISTSRSFPVEVWARACNAEVIFSHFSSALLNLRLYGFEGRVAACGLGHVKAAFLELQAFLEYRVALERLRTIEVLDPFEAQRDVNNHIPDCCVRGKIQ
jgi:hypothetical protein